jgi:porphobilinogen synthase
MTVAPYPATRFRRLRGTDPLRRLVRETRLTPDDLIWPLFVTEGDEEVAVPSMPGVVRHPVAGIVAAAKEAETLGIPAVCLFPYIDPALKTEGCEEAWAADNLSNRATRAIREAGIGVAVRTDVALDPYNANGHDGIVRDGVIVNDESVEALVRMALPQAAAGADVLGPSDMMDGRIGALRQALERERFQAVAIMSYSAKYASAFYGPFRDAVGSAKNLGKSN